jgi:hypothetical protein
MELTGMPLTLAAYPAETRTNRHFRDLALPRLDRIYLPPALTGLLDDPPLEIVEFREDDNRGAVTSRPVATLDGVEYHLSVKGVGSVVDPYASRALDRARAMELTADAEVRRRLDRPTVPPVDGEPDRIITGELWLRGSPYGGQGLGHAETALAVAERADLADLAGFLLAPVVKIAYFPPALEERLRSLHWYRRYRGRFVQELRLLPSNVRVYFHARQTVGNDIRSVFDLFRIDTDASALAFELAFVRSTLAMLTLFARTLRHDAARDRYVGLDFHDVWLDKDAVLAPDGRVFFVDLEGIEEVDVERARVPEKLEDQVYRSLYEFMFAYEQVEAERRRRFGGGGSRKEHLARLLPEALRGDPYLRVLEEPGGLVLEIGNALADRALYTRFPLVDR